VIYIIRVVALIQACIELDAKEIEERIVEKE